MQQNASDAIYAKALLVHAQALCTPQDEALPDNRTPRRSDAVTNDHVVATNALKAQKGMSGATQMDANAMRGNLLALVLAFNAANASPNRQMQLKHADATQNAGRGGGMCETPDILLVNAMLNVQPADTVHRKPNLNAI